jgi:hypothetical protein
MPPILTAEDNPATAADPKSEIGFLGRPNPLLRTPRGTPC